MIRRKSFYLLLTLLAFIASSTGLQAANPSSEEKSQKSAASKPASTKPAPKKPASHPVVELEDPVVATGPEAGEVYRVFEFNVADQNQSRVTDPNVKREDAWKFLPNRIHKFEITDLKDAIRAEVVVDRWGGHHSTFDKSIRFNGGKYLALPEIQGTEKGPEQYMSQDNPIIEVPLDQLKEGTNEIQGYCRGTWWGQWGGYAYALRVYYDPAKKAHTKAEIVAPVNGEELKSPVTIDVKANEGEIAKVEVLANYEDYDFDGNGVFKEYQGHYYQEERGKAAQLAHHVGTADAAPFSVTWDMQWVPEQTEDITLIARVQNPDGVWFVTQPVAGLKIAEREQTVTLYKASGVEPRFGVRANKTMTCKFVIPEGTDLSKAADAKLYMRTWNGTNEEHGDFLFNDFKVKGTAKNHHYAFTEHEIPVENLKVGENVVSFHSPTKHHHLEILWPGPGLVVRYKK